MQLRLLLWNMEWLNDLFAAGNGPFRPDGEKLAYGTGSVAVRKRRTDLSSVIREVEPDIVVVVEGPNRNEELDLFFRTDVGAEWRTFLQPTSGSAQCIGAAINIGTGKFDAAATRTIDSAASPAFGEFPWDTDADGVDEHYRFERLPVNVDIALVGGKRLRVLGLHLKSKAIFDACEWSKWWSMSAATAARSSRRRCACGSNSSSLTSRTRQPRACRSSCAATSTTGRASTPPRSCSSAAASRC